MKKHTFTATIINAGGGGDVRVDERSASRRRSDPIFSE